MREAATSISSHRNVNLSNQICNNLEKNWHILGFNLEKSFNKYLGNACFRQKGGGRK
jgi:hypothetical protein